MTKVISLSALAEKATDLYASISSSNKTDVTNSMQLAHYFPLAMIATSLICQLLEVPLNQR